MKIIFFGCVQFSFDTLGLLLSLKDADVVGVVTRNESAFNSDFCSLESLAKQYNIPCFLAQGNNQSAIFDWLKHLEPDVIYCFGWSYLLKPEILSIPRLGVIGYHPASLPQNRGRHPIIWALVLGLKETASTFFFMDEGADSGDILNQKFVKINDSDNALTLYTKLIEIAKEQIKDFTKDLATNHFFRVPQEHSKANYWRKRNKSDGQIDWRMSATNIHNLVRALTYPYVGAHCVLKDQELKIWKTEIVKYPFDNIEPGKVLSVNQTEIVVKCGKDAIKLIDHEFQILPKEGCYL